MKKTNSGFLLPAGAAITASAFLSFALRAAAGDAISPPLLAAIASSGGMLIMLLAMGRGSGNIRRFMEVVGGEIDHLSGSKRPGLIRDAIREDCACFPASINRSNCADRHDLMHALTHGSMVKRGHFHRLPPFSR